MEPKMSSPHRGIIYIVSGQKFIDQACRSAASIKKCMPDVPITIFADVPIDSTLFDQVVPIDSPAYDLKDKIFNMRKSPYRETLSGWSLG
jgi:hypothetical protein